MNEIEQKIEQLGLELPVASKPVANYVACVKTGNLVVVSGQLPLQNGNLIKGKLGDNLTEEEGIAAAEACALNILAQLKAEIGCLDSIKRCVKLTGFVNATNDYTMHPKIINGASDLMVKILGEKGKHARAALGVSSLPLGAAVEIEAIFEIE